MNSKLKKEIEKFKEWSKNFEPIPEIERDGEWELLYEDWNKLDDLMCDFLTNTNYHDWSEEETKLVLYLIARDNEDERFINTLVKNQPSILEFLAFKSFEFGEPNAKWQIAIRLDKMIDKKTAQLLLEEYLKDEDEYVRRRSLIMLAKFQHHNLEQFCEDIWYRKDKMQEYQRIAVLSALSITKSKELEKYIKLAIKDGSKFLVERANRLKSEL